MRSAAPDERLEVVHHFPGRLRVRARLFRDSPELAERLCQRLAAEAGVSAAEASPLTGSVLVIYEPRVLQLPRLIRSVLGESGLSGVLVDAERRELGEAIGGARVRTLADRANETLRQVTGGNVDLKVAVPGALASLGLGMFLFGKRRVPEWYDLLFWSFVTFVNMNPAQAPASVPDAGD